MGLFCVPVIFMGIPKIPKGGKPILNFKFISPSKLALPESLSLNGKTRILVCSIVIILFLLVVLISTLLISEFHVRLSFPAALPAALNSLNPFILMAFTERTPPPSKEG